MADSVKPPSCDQAVTFGDKSILFVQQVARRLCCHYSTECLLSSGLNALARRSRP
jgi:hypothetical protein